MRILHIGHFIKKNIYMRILKLGCKMLSTSWRLENSRQVKDVLKMEYRYLSNGIASSWHQIKKWCLIILGIYEEYLPLGFQTFSISSIRKILGVVCSLNYAAKLSITFLYVLTLHLMHLNSLRYILNIYIVMHAHLHTYTHSLFILFLNESSITD